MRGGYSKNFWPEILQYFIKPLHLCCYTIPGEHGSQKKHAGFFYARTFRFPTPVQVLNGPAAWNMV